MKKALVLIRGISGSGKTTYANHVAHVMRMENIERAVISADDFWGEEYAFDYSKIKEAHADCQHRTRTALMDDTTQVVVVHNTFAQAWEMAPYWAMAQDTGAKLYQTLLTVDVSVAMTRNVHNTPSEVILRQQENLEKSTARVLVETPNGAHVDFVHDPESRMAIHLGCRIARYIKGALG